MIDPDRYRNARVLVTGSSGFIGRHLVHALDRLGAAVTGVDLVSDADFEGVDFLHTDVLHLRHDDLADREIEIVFHLAAVVGVHQVWADVAHTFRVNAAGTGHVLGLCRSARVGRFCLASSSAVYGEPERLPIDESTEPRPRSVYGWSKYCAEQMLRLAHTPEMSGTIVRPFNVYGTGQRPDFVIPRFIRQALRSEDLTVVGTGAQQRVFIHIDDFVAGMLAAASLVRSEVTTFNISHGEPISIDDLASLIIRLTDSDSSIRRVSPRAIGRHPDSEVLARRARTDKAEQELGFRPKVSLPTGLQRLLREDAALWASQMTSRQ